jgi:multimeric flavodoxin WrbA
MKICILMGSPRKKGNTGALLEPFMEELDRARCEHSFFRLYDLKIAPCTACRNCQRDWSIFGCRFEDDLQEIFEAVLSSDLTLLATPVYSFFCTAPMKAALDRLVYGMNKYYGEEKGPALWAGKNIASIVTCGYRPEKGADLFEEGIRRYCKHSQLHYLGMLAERHLGYKSVFMDEGKEERARLFARKLLASAGNLH